MLAGTDPPLGIEARSGARHGGDGWAADADAAVERTRALLADVPALYHAGVNEVR